MLFGHFNAPPVFDFDNIQEKPSRSSFSKKNLGNNIWTRDKSNVVGSLKSIHQITDLHKLNAFEILKTSGIDSFILTNISFNPTIQNHFFHRENWWKSLICWFWIEIRIYWSAQRSRSGFWTTLRSSFIQNNVEFK